VHPAFRPEESHHQRALGRILMSTDYPYDMADYDPLAHVDFVDGFDTVTKAAIAGGNVQRLLAL
jgi:aminocarboxymuconate-semialdehyde decarboxylase